MSRENYFLLFNIEYNPPEENLQIIKSAIDNKVKYWGKEVNNPGPIGTEARFYLEKINEINEVLMYNKALRKKEAMEAFKIMQYKELKAEKELEEVVHCLSTKGFLTEKERDSLVKKYNVLSKDKVISGIRVPIKKDLTEDFKAKNEKLPKSEERYIEERLKFLGYNTLYDFLGINTISSIKLINYKVEVIYKSEISKCIKDERNNKIIDLLSMCKKIFCNEEERNKYDVTIKYNRLKKIEELYLEPQKINKELHQNTYNFIVNKIVSLGFSRDYAINYVKDYCITKGIGYKVPIDFKLDMGKKCGVCETFNSKDENYCKNCRAKLDVICPGCTAKISNSLIYCTYCNYPIGDMTNYWKQIEKSREERAKNNYDLALVALSNAKVYNSDAKEIDILEEEIKKEREIVKKNRKEVLRLQKEGSYYTVKELLLDPTFLLAQSFRREQLSNVEEVIKKVETLLNFNYIDDEEDKIRNIKTAKEICSDSKSIEKIAKFFPPESPIDCSYTVKKEGVELTWDSNSTIDVSYRIVRKINLEPISANDGKIIYEGAENYFLDKNIEFGEKYYYSIYTKRLGIFSKNIVVIGPVMIIKEVDILGVNAYTDSVSIQINVPRKAIEVKCFKRLISSQKWIGIGEEIKVDSRDYIKDYNISEALEYSYFIYCVYKDVYGENINSKGIEVNVKIPEKPKALENIQIHKNNNGLVVEVHSDYNDLLCVYYSEEKLSECNGQIFEELNFNENVLKGEKISDTNFLLNLKKDSKIYILPVIKKDGLYFVDKAIEYNFIREVSALKGENIDNKIYLTWNWPEKVKRVLIAYRTDGVFPKDSRDIESKIIPVTREMYFEEGFFKISNISTGEYYFKIFTMVEKDDKVNYSNGAELNVPFYKNVTISYKLERKKKFSGIFSSDRLLFININVTETDLEETFKRLVLVKKDNKLPISIEDGEIILEIDSEHLINNGYQGAIKYNDKDGVSFFRLFVEDENKFNKYNIIDMV